MRALLFLVALIPALVQAATLHTYTDRQFSVTIQSLTPLHTGENDIRVDMIDLKTGNRIDDAWVRVSVNQKSADGDEDSDSDRLSEKGKAFFGEIDLDRLGPAVFKVEVESEQPKGEFEFSFTANVLFDLD